MSPPSSTHGVKDLTVLGLVAESRYSSGSGYRSPPVSNGLGSLPIAGSMQLAPATPICFVGYLSFYKEAERGGNSGGLDGVGEEENKD